MTDFTYDIVCKIWAIGVIQGTNYSKSILKISDLWILTGFSQKFQIFSQNSIFFFIKQCFFHKKSRICSNTVFFTDTPKKNGVVQVFHHFFGNFSGKIDFSSKYSTFFLKNTQNTEKSWFQRSTPKYEFIFRFSMQNSI